MLSVVLNESGSFRSLKGWKDLKKIKGWWWFWVLAPVLSAGKSPSISLKPAFYPLCFQVLFCTWDFAVRKVKELWQYAKHTLSKVVCMWSSRLRQTDQRAETRSLPPGWIPITLLTLCLWPIESWKGHGITAAVLRQPSLMGLTVGVPVRLYACQCPRGLADMQS